MGRVWVADLAGMGVEGSDPPPDVSCVQAGRAQVAGVRVVQSDSLGSEGLVVQPLQLRWELS